MKRRLSMVVTVFIFFLLLGVSTTSVMAEDNPANNNNSTQRENEIKSIIYNNTMADGGQNISKAEYCKILVDLYQYLQQKLDNKTPAPGVNPTSSPYTDTEDPYILKAYALGIIPPAADGLFHPQDNLTAQEQAIMLYNTLKLLDPTIENDIPDNQISAAGDKAAPGANQAFSFLCSQEVIQPDDTLNPSKAISREEANQITLAAAQNLLAIKKFYLYGYQVINSAYASPDGSSANRILDEKKLNAAIDAGTVRIDEFWYNGSESEIFVSNQATDLYSSLSVKAKGEYDGPAFSASVEAEYGSEEQITTDSTFIKHQEIKTVSEIGLDIGATKYEDFLSDGFIKDVEDKSMSAAELFKKYGTHLPIHYKLGGKVELNANFQNRTEIKMTNAEIEASVRYGYSSGSVETELGKKKETIQNNSRITCFAQGGNYIGGTSIDDIRNQLPKWRKSVTADNYNLCGFFDSGLMPIWELLDSTHQQYAQKLKDEFMDELQAEGTRLAGFNPPKGPVITDIIIKEYTSDQNIEIPAGYEVVTDFGQPTNSMDKAIDFDKGTGGKFIYMFYKKGWLTDKYAKNITNLFTSVDGIVIHDLPEGEGWNIIPLNLNSHGGADVYLYWANKNPSHFTDIKAFYTDNSEYVLPAGYEKPEHSHDLNYGCPNDDVKKIYLALKREDNPIQFDTLTYDRAYASDVTTKVNFRDKGRIPKITTIIKGTQSLGPSHYSYNDNQLTITKEYLQQQPWGKCDLTVYFDNGYVIPLYITIVDSARTYPSEAIFDKEHPANVETEINYNDADYKMGIVVRKDLTPIGSDNYVLADPGETDWGTKTQKLTIKKEYLANQPAGDLKLTIEFSKGKAATLTITIKNTAAINPTIANFDKNMSKQADVTANITWKESTKVTDIKNGITSIGAENYWVSGNTLTIKKEFMAKQAVGQLKLIIEFDKSDPVTLTINITDSTPAIISAVIAPNVASFDKYPAKQADVTAGITWNSASQISDIKCGGESIGSVNYLVINNTLAIRRDFLAKQAVGNMVLSIEFDKGGPAILTIGISETIPPVVSASLNPDSANFDKHPALQMDVSTNITWNSASQISDIKNGENAIGAENYIINGNTLAIRKEFLAKQAIGSLVLSIAFDKGEASNLTIEISDTTPPVVSAVINPDADSFDKNPAIQADVTATITWNSASQISDIKSSGNPIGSGNYSVSGNTLAIRKAYLATLAEGSLPLSIEFDKGNPATLTINIVNTVTEGADMAFIGKVGMSPKIPLAGGTVTVTCNVINQGNQASKNCKLKVYLLNDPDDDLSAGILLGQTMVTKLNVKMSKSYSLKCKIPGDLRWEQGFIKAIIDADELIVEMDEDNNTIVSSPISFKYPDLMFVPGSFKIPAKVKAGAKINIQGSIINKGSAAAGMFSVNYYLWDGSNPDSKTDLLGTCKVSSLKVNKASAQKARLTIPAGLAPGTWYLWAEIDEADAVYETTDGESNNCSNQDLSLTIS